MTLASPGDDRQRCAWVDQSPLYRAYHDDEWGRALHGETALFERLTLEGFQSGLSWLVILRKREFFRAAFAGFDIDAVAAFDDDDVERLMRDTGIVRNRSKILATIANARAVRANIDDLDALMWSYAPASHARPTSPGAIPSTSVESVALAAHLRRCGIRFVGPTTAYALMQATGMVDDHVSACWRAQPA